MGDNSPCSLKGFPVWCQVGMTVAHVTWCDGSNQPHFIVVFPRCCTAFVFSTEGLPCVLEMSDGGQRLRICSLMGRPPFEPLFFLSIVCECLAFHRWHPTDASSHLSRSQDATQLLQPTAVTFGHLVSLPRSYTGRQTGSLPPSTFSAN